MLTLGALVFPKFELLDLFGPLEMFGMYPKSFDIRIVAETAGPVASTQGPRIAVDTLTSAGTKFDILLVPGGAGARHEVENQALLGWLGHAAADARIVTSVCTGSALLARAGLLDGLRATTNKRAFDWVASLGPATDWQRRARWVEDGRFITASGVSAGIDMALAVIARELGTDAARDAALWAEYLPNTDPDDDPFAAD